jgi:hypothetical protein
MYQRQDPVTSKIHLPAFRWFDVWTVTPEEDGPARWWMQVKLASKKENLTRSTRGTNSVVSPTWLHMGFVRLDNDLGGTGHHVYPFPTLWPDDEDVPFTHGWEFKAVAGQRVLFRFRHNGMGQHVDLHQAKVSNEPRPPLEV